jgi:hypothetical protein
LKIFFLPRFRSTGEKACTLLAKIHAWFTEGFDTTDLTDAKALLEKLSAAQCRGRRPKHSR